MYRELVSGGGRQRYKEVRYGKLVLRNGDKLWWPKLIVNTYSLLDNGKEIEYRFFPQGVPNQNRIGAIQGYIGQLIGALHTSNKLT